MIVDFSLRSSVFSESGELSHVVPIHRMLLNAWRIGGRLRIFDLEALVSLITQLPGEIRRLWLEALKDSSFPKLIHNFDPDSCSCRADVEGGLRNLDLIAIPGSEAKSFFSSEGAFAELCANGVELARVEFISESKRFQAAIGELTGRIAKDTKRADWIANYLARRIVNVEHFVIVDRYFLKNMSNNGSLEASAAGGVSELIKCMPRLKSLKIFSSETGVVFRAGKLQERAEEFLRELEGEVRSYVGTAPSLELIINKDHRFGEEVHDRYFRFDRVTFDVGLGAEVLASSRVRRNTNYTIGFKGQDYRDAYESRLNSTSICSVRI